jgi:hypothetical protein
MGIGGVGMGMPNQQVMPPMMNQFMPNYFPQMDPSAMYGMGLGGMGMGFNLGMGIPNAQGNLGGK